MLLVLIIWLLPQQIATEKFVEKTYQYMVILNGANTIRIKAPSMTRRVQTTGCVTVFWQRLASRLSQATWWVPSWVMSAVARRHSLRLAARRLSFTVVTQGSRSH
ncbi:MAG: hypothetical protein IJ610_09845 [Bacteroidaceae bacterium]|nr:hypothetical protein [Bacteroidaceae bacterium]